MISALPALTRPLEDKVSRTSLLTPLTLNEAKAHPGRSLNYCGGRNLTRV
ncbi:MAG: hypothetical protein JWQ49_5798 [Edaphobacter sp.]|nr:hypothetical protein [Edaphobacter sp.]